MRHTVEYRYTCSSMTFDQLVFDIFIFVNKLFFHLSREWKSKHHGQTQNHLASFHHFMEITQISHNHSETSKRRHEGRS